jgi:hypothetical protein
MIALYEVLRPGSRWNPRELVAFAWGSKSMISVFCSDAAREAPKLTAVVVFPTPPFWLAIEITRAKYVPQYCGRI